MTSIVEHKYITEIDNKTPDVPFGTLSSGFNWDEMTRLYSNNRNTYFKEISCIPRGQREDCKRHMYAMKKDRLQRVEMVKKSTAEMKEKMEVRREKYKNASPEERSRMANEDRAWIFKAVQKGDMWVKWMFFCCLAKACAYTMFGEKFY